MRSATPTSGCITAPGSSGASAPGARSRPSGWRTRLELGDVATRGTADIGKAKAPVEAVGFGARAPAGYFDFRGFVLERKIAAMLYERAPNPPLAVTTVDHERDEPGPCARTFEERNDMDRRAAGKAIVNA